MIIAPLKAAGTLPDPAIHVVRCNKQESKCLRSFGLFDFGDCGSQKLRPWTHRHEYARVQIGPWFYDRVSTIYGCLLQPNPEYQDQRYQRVLRLAPEQYLEPVPFGAILYIPFS